MIGWKAPALVQRGAASPQGLKPATKSLLQRATLERLSASNAKKQQSNNPPRGQTGLSRKATPKGPSTCIFLKLLQQCVLQPFEDISTSLRHVVKQCLERKSSHRDD